MNEKDITFTTMLMVVATHAQDQSMRRYLEDNPRRLAIEVTENRSMTKAVSRTIIAASKGSIGRL